MRIFAPAWRAQWALHAVLGLSVHQISRLTTCLMSANLGSLLALTTFLKITVLYA